MSENKFNEKQKLVIETLDKNILLLAGAGTGKTNTLSYRISNIIEKEKATAKEILCITFTNKACKEMKDRILENMGSCGQNITVRTFHSFCFDIVKSEAKKRTDIFTDFTVYDENDCEEIIKKVNYFNHPIQSLQNFINLVKEHRAIYNVYSENSVDDYRNVISILKTEEPYKLKRVSVEKYKFSQSIYDKFLEHGQDMVEAYNRILYGNHGLDFTDLIVKAKELFNQPKVVERICEKFKYINIDEVQDTSILEYSIIEKIFNKNNILLCGDSFQTIYEWRGSTPENIFERYLRKYNPLKINFDKNYRATKVLTNASCNYLKNAFDDKIDNSSISDIKAYSKEVGEKIKYFKAENINEEAKWILNEIKKINKEHPSKICVLTRNNKYNIELSQQLAMASLREKNEANFILIDQFKFFRRQEVKDILAFIKLIVNKNDNNSLSRILRRLKTGIGERTLSEIQSKEYKEVGINLSDFIDLNTFKYGDKFIFLHRELEKNNVIVFDVESTGVDTTEDEIIQIAAIRINNKGEAIEVFERFLKNNKSVKDSEYVHGFSDEYLEKHGNDKIKVLKEFLEFSRGAVIVGHNVQFDISILASELSRNKLDGAEFIGVYDTLDIYRRFYPNMCNHKLETLSKAFNTNHKPSHNAMDDILATGELLVKGIYDKILPTTLKRQSLILKHLKSFKEISIKLIDFIEKSKGLRPQDIVALVVNEFNIKEIYINEPNRINNLREFYLIAKELDNKEKNHRDSLMEFIQITSLSNGEMERLMTKGKRIPIITVHQAKGLEFEYVFLSGLYEPNFPSYQSIKENYFEEEKRIFYVAMTRAKKMLYLTSISNNRYVQSRFIKYINKEFIEEI